MNRYSFFVLILLLTSVKGFSQDEYLSIEDAIKIAMENNYNIQVAGNNKSIAENNTSVFNTGVLPVISANAGSGYDYSRQKIKQEGIKTADRGHSFPFSAGISVNYSVFDKADNFYVEQLDEFFNLSDLQFRQSVEQVLANVILTYYQVTTLERNIAVQQANLEVSKRNLTRAEYAVEYGVSTQLGVLNNEVNVNNDSIVVQNSLVNFENARRNLNVLLGRDPAVVFTTDTVITYKTDFNLETILSETENNNIQMLLANQNISIEQLNMDIAKAGWLPTINANGSYNWNQNFVVNDPTDYIVNDGFNTGLSLSWNIFDGGRTKTQVQNAAIAIDNTNLFKDELWRQLQRDVSNNWRAYENALFVVATQLKNIETSERNFSRTQEQFKLGNISTTTFREAQTNLLNAQLGYLQALYEAKVLETTLLQLSGNLIRE